jgi:signal transduction histidine kinase
MTGVLKNRVGTLTKLIDDTIQAIRKISISLRPGILDDLGIAAALSWQARRFRELTGIACTCSADVETTDIRENHATTLFRICQECLTNVARHADATKVQVTLREKGGKLVLTVEDNGRGITEEEGRSPTSLGILGMRERILNLGGTFSIRGRPGRETRVRVEVPVG